MRDNKWFAVHFWARELTITVWKQTFLVKPRVLPALAIGVQFYTRWPRHACRIWLGFTAIDISHIRTYV